MSGSTLKGKIAKIVIYEVRVNGGTNYDYPGQRWVPKLVHHNIKLNRLSSFVGGFSNFFKISMGNKTTTVKLRLEGFSFFCIKHAPFDFLFTE